MNVQNCILSNPSEHIAWNKPDKKTPLLIKIIKDEDNVYEEKRREQRFTELIEYRNFQDTRIRNLEDRVKTLEQYQANILDKLTVFAEMIDNNNELKTN